MSPEEIRQALEPFRVFGNVLTTKTRDAGLALPLARSFAGQQAQDRQRAGPRRGCHGGVALRQHLIVVGERMARPKRLELLTF